MAEGIAYAHDRGVKVYVTANILAHNGDLEAASDYFMELKHLKTKDGRPVPPDALIISDPGLFMIAKRVCPEIELHISTQANSTNYETGCSGGIWAQSVWFPHGSFPWQS